jgi:hypothetical protein
MTGALRIHALVILARVLVRIGAAAEGLSLACRRRAGRILDEAVAWCDARDAVNRRGWLIFEEKGRRANAPPRSRAGRIRSVLKKVASKGL